MKLLLCREPTLLIDWTDHWHMWTVLQAQFLSLQYRLQVNHVVQRQIYMEPLSNGDWNTDTVQDCMIRIWLQSGTESNKYHGFIYFFLPACGHFCQVLCCVFFMARFFCRLLCRLFSDFLVTFFGEFFRDFFGKVFVDFFDDFFGDFFVVFL